MKRAFISDAIKGIVKVWKESPPATIEEWNNHAHDALNGNTATFSSIAFYHPADTLRFLSDHHDSFFLEERQLYERLLLDDATFAILEPLSEALIGLRSLLEVSQYLTIIQARAIKGPDNC